MKVVLMRPIPLFGDREDIEGGTSCTVVLHQLQVANKACAARVRLREQELMKSRIKNMKPQALRHTKSAFGL